MKPNQITEKIKKETGGNWSITNWHGCDLEKSLIRPKKRKVRCGDKIKELWIVLEEIPETLEGCKVYFDEETEKFGLVFHSEPFGYAANSRDTFIDAFKSM